MANPISFPLAKSTEQINPSAFGLMTEPINDNKPLFHDMLMKSLDSVMTQQSNAKSLVEEHLLGHGVTDIEVLTAIKEAELSLKTIMQVRNKAVEAYQELKQIQV